jgi:ethanolamine ammonia-lyase small subunit
MSEQRPPPRPPIAAASKPAPDEPWAELRRFTAARIALPRSGASLATAPLLEFRLAHARARDAVHAPFDDARLCAELAPLGLRASRRWWLRASAGWRSATRSRTRSTPRSR